MKGRKGEEHQKSIKKFQTQSRHTVLRGEGSETGEKVRKIKALWAFRATPKPWVAGSNPPAPAKSLGRFRSDREKTRKAEISRDFSAFFAPNFFRISIDPFSIFLRVEGFELPKTHFFMN